MEISNTYKIEDWDDYYQREKKIHIKPKDGFFSSYDIYLCNVLFQNYLFIHTNGRDIEKNKKSICEIGCGDGTLVKKIGSRYGYKPYGIEYSDPASDTAEKNGVTVIRGDAFDEALISQYENAFDIVYSYGFVEHIYPPEKAIAIHRRLLKPGGRMCIQIPRLKGFNYWKVRIFRPELLPLHNLDIMEEEALRLACIHPDIKEIVCKNYGTFKLRVPMDKKNIRYHVLRVITLFEYLSNPLLRFFFGTKGCETRFFSPAVMFIGEKKLQ